MNPQRKVSNEEVLRKSILIPLVNKFLNKNSTKEKGSLLSKMLKERNREEKLHRRDIN